MSKPGLLVMLAASLTAGLSVGAAVAGAAQAGSLPHHVVQVGSPPRQVVVVECDRYGRLVSQPCPPATDPTLRAIQERADGAEVISLDGERLLPPADPAAQ